MKKILLTVAALTMATQAQATTYNFDIDLEEVYGLTCGFNLQFQADVDETFDWDGSGDTVAYKGEGCDFEFSIPGVTFNNEDIYISSFVNHYYVDRPSICDPFDYFYVNIDFINHSDPSEYFGRYSMFVGGYPDIPEFNYQLHKEGGYHFWDARTGLESFGHPCQWSITAETEPVPEPATMLLIGVGVAGLAGLRGRK